MGDVGSPALVGTATTPEFVYALLAQGYRSSSSLAYG
jgi:hypothetical protein